MSAPARRRIRVRGLVQGVGFRPFVHRLATGLGVSGSVVNDGDGVLVEAEGAAAALDAFAMRLRDDAPPNAAVGAIEVTAIAPAGDEGFRVLAGGRAPGTRTAVAPDLATCADCLRELHDPLDRRHGHPFISCTACGPRFTFVTALPYDRERTTMAGFPLCPACRAEYEDPADRRFHAESICCPDCGPALRLVRPDGGHVADGDAALASARDLLAGGRIVAIKGIGGYHLACDAGDGAALARLRLGKGREAKPFAVMPAALDGARELAQVGDEAAALLASPQAPIVLLQRRADAPLQELVAPASPFVGVLLPYTPVHHLLMTGDGQAPPVLVMTSGNRSEEPIAHEDDDALARIGPIADALLVHDRPIAAPCDDSVVRLHAGGVLPLRRARGYVPRPVPLPSLDVEPVLAVGGELKAAVALASGSEVVLGQHLGDVGDPATLEALERSALRLAGLVGVEPRVLACDAHPGYRSSGWARRAAAGRPLVEVQHHHAHAAAVLVEHGLAPDAEAIAVTFDGSGYGDDGAVWGGEVLVASCRASRRFAHLAPVPLPGGEAAIRRPARMALAHLWAAGIEWADDLPPVAALAREEREIVRHQLRTGLNSPPTTSAGRLFDAVASLAGVCQVARFEGEAAMALEGLAGDLEQEPYPVELEPGDPSVIAVAPLVAGVVADVRASGAPASIAARLHATLAEAAAAAARAARERTGLTRVALSGGVFQNVLLLQLTETRLRDAGFEVLTHRLVPPNDGGLALGQAAVAAAAGVA